MSKWQIISKVVVSILIAIPVGFILAMLITPLLWKLEEVVPIELAGHSGPAIWVFNTTIVFVATAIFIMLTKFRKK